MESKAVKLFEDVKIRSVWDEQQEEWYFSVVDVVQALTESVNPTDYLKKLRKRDIELGGYMGTNCPHVEMLTETGKKRKTLAATTEHLLRIIQAIPSKKASVAGRLKLKRLQIVTGWNGDENPVISPKNAEDERRILLELLENTTDFTE